MDQSLSYDYLVKQEALMFQAVLLGASNDPAQFAHRWWRRCIEGWTLGDVLADTLGRVPVIGGYGTQGELRPPDGLHYELFLVEQLEIAETVAAIHGLWTAGDLAHNGWRRLIERGVWTHANLLHDIKGEPLEPVAVPEPPIDPTDPEPLPLPPGVYPPPPGPSRLEGRVWRLADGRAYLPHAVHFMEAFSLWCRDEPACRGQLTRIADLCHQHGVTPCIRFLDTLGFYDYWRGREVAPISFTAKGGYHVEATPDYYGRLAAFLAYVRDLGMLVRWSRGDLQLFGEGSSQQTAVQDHVQQGAAALSAVGVDVLEHWTACNECELNGVEEPTEADRYCQAFTASHPGVLAGYGAPYGTEESHELLKWAGGDFSSVHGYRPGNDSLEESEKTLRHLFSVRREGYGDQSAEMPICQDEPTGPGEDVSGGRTDSVELLTLLAVLSHVTAQAWTYMSGWGVRHNGPIETQPGFSEVLRTTAQLPADLYGWHIFRGGNSENPWTSDSGFYGDSGVTHGPGRIDGASSPNGRFVVMVYGGKAPRVVRAQHRVEFFIWHPADDSRQGPYTMQPGDTREITYEIGRVLVGRFL